jgi:hypothetical protein
LDENEIVLDDKGKGLGWMKIGKDCVGWKSKEVGLDANGKGLNLILKGGDILDGNVWPP